MRPRKRDAPGELPPHAPEAEMGLLGCILLGPHEGMAACELAKVGPHWFYISAHRTLWPHVVALHEARVAPDIVSVAQRLRDAGALDELGGLAYLSSLQDATPSAANLPYFLEVLREKSELRWQLQRAAEIREKITAGGTAEQLRELLKESAERIDAGLARAGGDRSRPIIEMVAPSEISKFKVNGKHQLIGDTDFRQGYEGLTIIGGPPGSGKSLLSSTLALAGARGHGEWMGRKIHRKFRTLILGAENGRMRWKRDLDQMTKLNPDLDLESHVRVVLPPEGGLCFHRSEFRRAIRTAVLSFGPDLVVIDPWTSVAVDDSSKDVVDKLAEIRACFPSGDDCPSTVVVAHTKKPRAEEMGNRGRALMYSISGSQALVSTARCVYVLLPFTDDIQDHRVLWCCSKLSDGNAPEDRVYQRVLGREFPATADNPEEYWTKGENDQGGVWLRPEMVRDFLAQAVADRRAFSTHGLAVALAERHNQGRGVSSVHRWLKAPEFAGCLEKVGGFVTWKEGTK